MAHYDDLSPCRYFGTSLPVRSLLAVGWLEPGYPYTSGDPGRDVYQRLQEFRWRVAWQPVSFAGGHTCELAACRYGSFYSHHNIFVPAHDVVYVAPEGIVHYISCHDYLPPAEFCAAVLASPDAGTPGYYAALRASGFEGAGETRSMRRWWRRFGLEARGRALVETVESFRRIRGRWPHTLDEAEELVDDAGAWHYARDGRGFTLTTDWRAREACSLRYESSERVWHIETTRRRSRVSTSDDPQSR